MNKANLVGWLQKMPGTMRVRFAINEPNNCQDPLYFIGIQGDVMTFVREEGDPITCAQVISHLENCLATDLQFAVWNEGLVAFDECFPNGPAYHIMLKQED